MFSRVDTPTIARVKRLPSGLRALLATSHKRQVEKNQVLYYQGDTVSNVLYLKDGIVKVYDIDDAGNEKILHLFKGPSFLPLALFGGPDIETRWFYATLTDCVLTPIVLEELEALLFEDSESLTYMLRWYYREVHEILTRLNSLSKTQTKEKLIAALKYFATFHLHATQGRWHAVTFPVTHQLLADFIGVSRESVTYCLHELQGEKLIKLSAQSTLLINRDKLFKHY